MFTTFQSLLLGNISDSDQYIENLILMNEEERQQILVKWNSTRADYPQDQCIHQLFETQVGCTPDAIAAVFEDNHITYRELNLRANQLAHYLQPMGVGPEVIVGICMERSLNMLIGLLSILKAGGAYLPLDPSYPKERLAFMLEDAGVPLLLTQERLLKAIPGSDAKVVCLDLDWASISHESVENPVSEVVADNLSYVIFTSGSTGNPKGVAVSHRSIGNRLLWGQTEYQLDCSDRVCLTFSVSFDASIVLLFQPLLAGACLILPQPGMHRDSTYLVEIIADHQVTVTGFSSSMFRQVIDEPGFKRCTGLRHVLTGIEPLSTGVKEAFFEQVSAVLHHSYGPTEASVSVTHCRCTSGHDQKIVPIGRPIANMQVYILDKSLNPVPVGIQGELYIGGIGLARGYLNRPKLTNTRFIPNIFGNHPNSRLYKTGDLGRYLADGNIEHLGRIDHQVKIRGLRIELGEIEAQLNQYPQIKNSVVIAKEHDPGDKLLIAYIVSTNKLMPTADELRRFLKQYIPDYMVPSAFIPLKKFPLTPNGKIDRNGLPAVKLESFSSIAYAAPENPTEELLASIWETLLGLKQIGIHHNFFEMGGHSLLATQIISRIRKSFSIEIPLRSLFENPTVAELSQRIETTLWVKENNNPVLESISDNRQLGEV